LAISPRIDIAILSAMRHQARKRFSQHFLRDFNVIESIVDCIVPRKGQPMVEIGPGLGAITVPLLERLGRLEVVELDRDLIPKLQAYCAHVGELVVHNEDALKFDFNRLAPPTGKLRVVGNLPYQISTPLLFRLIRYVKIVDDMHFLLQKEVVDRITAPAGSHQYGRLSVMLQYRCYTECLFNVGPGAFSPPPRVDSALIRLVPYAELPITVSDERHFSQIVALAFAHRRKTLKNALKDRVSPETIVRAGIEPSARAETVSLQQFASLANHSCLAV
jgi:16S rRNA (adenine1518-N6/adenine1519-N6)-dimethyltransferase